MRTRSFVTSMADDESAVAVFFYANRSGHSLDKEKAVLRMNAMIHFNYPESAPATYTFCQIGIGQQARSASSFICIALSEEETYHGQRAGATRSLLPPGVD